MKLLYITILAAMLFILNAPGNIVCAQQVKADSLKTVIVTAVKSYIKQDIDKMTYDIGADPESKGSNVLDMMRKVPFLSVDGRGSIQLNGSRSFRIFINGKPSALVEQNPEDILRTMPASTIKSIEVITNPSARYDAEGLAGIINIITYKKMADGYSSTIKINYEAPAGGPGAGSSFAFKSRKLGLSLLSGGSLSRQPAVDAWSDRTGTSSDVSQLHQRSTRSASGRKAYGGLQISYELDSLHLLSAEYNATGSVTRGSITQYTHLQKTTDMESYDMLTNNHNTSDGLDAAINYQMGFRSGKERLLTFSYRYLQNNNRHEDQATASHQVNYDGTDYQQLNKGKFDEQTVQVDYVQAFRKLSLEAGVKGIARDNKSDYRFYRYDSSLQAFRPDQRNTNQFNNQQYILAAYNTWQYKIKNWSVKLGVRAEQTIVNAHFITDSGRVHQNYFNIIPSASVMRKLKGGNSLNLSYSNRLQRPAIQQLNPFTDRSNPAMLSSGNPSLGPGSAHNIQLSYSHTRKGFINIALAGRFMNNMISTVTTYDADMQVTRTTYENLGSAAIYKTNIFIDYPVSRQLNFKLNSDFRYITARFAAGDQRLNPSGMAAFLNVSGSYRLKSTWRLSADITWNSGGLSGMQSTTNGYIGSSCMIQKDLVKGKLNISASASNPFTKYRVVREEIVGVDFIQTRNDQIYYRALNLGINYRFGKLKEAVKKNKRGITNDDVELK